MLRTLFQLVLSLPWKTLAGYAPCTYSVYKDAHSFASVALVVVAVSVSPRQVSAIHRSCNSSLSGRNPKASFCRYLFSFRQPKCTQQRMKFSDFACKSLNKLIHSLNGSYVCVETYTPKFRFTLWKNSFTLPNCMIVFDYAFYGRDKLWLKYFRRGTTYEIDTDRSSSTRLCGVMLRSVASRGGGPGSRWTYLHAYGKSWKGGAQRDPAQIQGQQQPIYVMDDLRYGDPTGHDDIYNIDDSDDIYPTADFPLSQTAQSPSVQCGNNIERGLMGSLSLQVVAQVLQVAAQVLQVAVQVACNWPKIGPKLVHNWSTIGPQRMHP